MTLLVEVVNLFASYALVGARKSPPVAEVGESISDPLSLDAPPLPNALRIRCDLDRLWEGTLSMLMVGPAGDDYNRWKKDSDVLGRRHEIHR